MKFIKYPFYNNILKQENKLRFKNLDKKTRKNVRINKIITFVLFTLYFMLIVSFIVLIKYLISIIENQVIETLMMIGMILATIAVPIVIIVLIYCLISKYIPPCTIGKLTPKNIQDITLPLKKYYKVSAYSIVTKCYKSSNESFNNKDVMVFLYNGKIRIVLDFNHTIKDYGCYDFKPNEFSVSYVEDDGILKALLKTGDVEFLLGRRAKPFIRKCLSLSKCPCCGYYTFLEIERGLFSICPVCFWEDDLDQVKNPNDADSANKVSLVEARKNYKEFGACEREFVKYCRPPKGNEIKRK